MSSVSASPMSSAHNVSFLPCRVLRDSQAQRYAGHAGSACSHRISLVLILAPKMYVELCKNQAKFWLLKISVEDFLDSLVCCWCEGLDPEGRLGESK